MIIAYRIRLYLSSYRFLSGKKPPLITRQKASTESIADAHGLDNPTFVSDVTNTILHTPISNQSAYLKTPESKTYMRI